MADAPTLSSVLHSVRPLVEAGASLHWLHPFDAIDADGVKRGKTPLAAKWSEESTLTIQGLTQKHRSRANIGVRLGQPSRLFGHYLHLIDLDIRRPELADEAWAALLTLWPDARRFPTVISGSGGASRHIYFLTTQPFRKKNLAKSKGQYAEWDERLGRNVSHHDWEIDLMGTGSQAVLPPSLHPDTHMPYRWEREIDISSLDFGIGPIVPVATVEAWGARLVAAEADDDDLETLFNNSPMDLSEDEIDEILSLIPNDHVETVNGEDVVVGAHYDDYIEVGMALHHQYQGDEDGYEKWVEWASQSSKFEPKHARYRWDRSFGGAKNPVRMATLIQKANNNRLAADHDFTVDDFDGGPAAPATGTALVPVAADRWSLDDLLSLDPNAQKPAEAAVSAAPRIDPDWQSLFHRGQDNGELKTTLHNISLIIRNDTRTHGVAAFNEFTQEICLYGSPKRVKNKRASAKPVVNLEGRLWSLSDPINGDPWSDSHDTAIRAVIEAPTTQGGYGIKVSDRDLRGAIDTAAQSHAFHPVRKALMQETWDGQKRAEMMFIDYLGCPDTPYHRAASMMTLLGAVARVFEPGHKFDFVPILEGVQGKGKSTFIRVLALDWYNELTGDISDPKEMVEVMQGSWIMEIGELSSMHRSEVNELKAFVSRTHDKTRLAYERRARTYARQCIFIGSTNDQEYLRDMTGGRRYWPIKCHLDGQIDNVRFASEVRQIWAEAVAFYHEMRRKQPLGMLPLHLREDAANEAEVIQESRRIETAEDVLAGQIAAWLGRPVDDGTGFDDLDPDAPKVYRDVTCTPEIWIEVMGGRVGQIPQAETMRIGKAMSILGWSRSQNIVRSYPVNEKYGPCRVYRKKG